MAQVHLLLYGHGKVIHGSQGVCYNRGPVKRIKIPADVDYVQFERVIANAMRLNEGSRLEICHRYPVPSYGPSGINFVLVPIGDDEDVRLLCEFAMSIGDRIQEVDVISVSGNYSNKGRSTNSRSKHGSNMQAVGVNVDEWLNVVQERMENFEVSRNFRQLVPVNERCSGYGGNVGNEEDGDNEDDGGNDYEDDYEEGDPFEDLERDMGDEEVLNETIYRRYENHIVDSIVNSDEDANTDDEMFNGVDLGNEDNNVGVNEAGPSRKKRLEKPLPFYLDSGDIGKVIFEEDEEVRMTDDPDAMVEFRKGMRFKHKNHLIHTVNMFHIKNH
ncbi:hypothetical protein MLD38_036137 [Melastoma candidum]|uniref:Uncharacterized protein n=1 Tax=Melastoma candidum TaxID=119954 RepID=A0ACB9LJ73_9MYRT|nr:hypothetical protein MLD38_036137 [Melastoma candidum]